MSFFFYYYLILLYSFQQKSIALAKKIDKLETVDQFLKMVNGVPEDEVDSTIMSKSKCS